MIHKFKQFESNANGSEIIDMIKDCSYALSDKYKTDIVKIPSGFKLELEFPISNPSLNSMDDLHKILDYKKSELELYTDIGDMISKMKGIRSFNIEIVPLSLYSKFNQINVVMFFGKKIKNKKFALERIGDKVSIDIELLRKMSDEHNLSIISITPIFFNKEDVSIKVQFNNTDDDAIASFSNLIMEKFPFIIDWDYVENADGFVRHDVDMVRYEFNDEIKGLII